MSKHVARTWIKSRATAIVAALAVTVSSVVIAIPSQASTSVSYDFNTAGQLAANFNATYNSAYTSGSEFTQSNSGGVANTGAIYNSSSSREDAVFSSKDRYSLGPAGSTYTFTSFVKSVGSNGYSGMGFTADGTTNSGYPYRPNDALGVSVHGGGFIFHNGATDYTGFWNPDEIARANNGLTGSNLITPVTEITGGQTDLLGGGFSPDSWFKFTFIAERTGAASFDLRVEMTAANADGSLRSQAPIAVFELNNITNNALANSPALSSYVNFSGYRFSHFDDYRVDLGGGSSVIPAGYPVVLTAPASISGNSATLNGSVTSDGGSTITERGFVYSTAPNPDITDNSDTKVAVTGTTGVYSTSAQLADGTYFIRAYATTNAGTSYGSQEELSFGPSVLSMYFSAPFVQGSNLTGQGVLTENFNGFAASTCPTVTAVATVTGSGCSISAGAGTDPVDGEQRIGLSLSNFVGSSGTMNLTYDFNTKVRYVGLWWMMGSANNAVYFLDENGVELAKLDSQDIMNFFGSNALVTNADTRTVTRVDGQTHLKKRYYRNPGSYSGTVASPVMDYSVASYANEPWVYLNLYVSGPAVVKKVRFSGVNFEFDNLTTSIFPADPRGDMVLFGNVARTQNITWAPTTAISSTNPRVIPSSLAQVTSPQTGGGAISYSVVSAGTAGCTVNASTGEITRTAAGSCVIRATAAAVAGNAPMNAATKDVSFTFSAAPVEPAPAAPTIIAPPAVESVEVKSGGSSKTSVVKVRIGERSANAPKSTIRVKLFDFNGKILQELDVPVTAETNELEIPVELGRGSFQVEALAVNSAGVSNTVAAKPRLVKQNFFTVRPTTQRPVLTGSVVGKPVYFAANSAVLSAAAKVQLTKLAEELSANNSRVALTGFASRWVKGRSAEQTLASRRALAVGNFLKEQGLQNWIYYTGFGSLRDSFSKSQERKVEIRVIN